MKNFYNKFKIVKIIQYTFAFHLFILCHSLELNADNLEKGNAVVQEMMTKAQEHAIKTISLEPEKRSLKIKELINKYINLNFMARATTGSFWKKATNLEKEKYKTALLNQIIKTIEDHLNTLSSLTYKAIDSELRGKKLVYVRGVIVDPKKIKPDVNLLWKLAANTSGSFLVLDLEIEGISLVSSHKSETMSILRKNKGDFEMLLNKFNEKQ